MADNLIRTKQINQADLSGAVQNVINSNQYQITYGGTGININDVGQITISGTDIYLIDSVFNVSGTGVFNALDLNNIDTLNLSGVNINITSGDITLTNRPTVNGIPVLLSGEGSTATLPTTLVYTTGNQLISGVKTFNLVPIVSGNPLITGDLSLYATTINLATTGSTLDRKINNLSGYVTGVTGIFAVLPANLALTGSTLDTKINTLSGYVTGVTGTFGILPSNLASTGSTLDNKINSLSGYVNSSSVVLPNSIVYTSGAQTISGAKTFLDSGIFSLSGALASGLPNNPLSVVGSGNTYLQLNIQNRSTGAYASADLVITANNGSDNANFINLGINNIGYNDPLYNNATGLDGYLFIDGGDLDIGTRTAGKIIEFHAGGTTESKVIARISESGLNIISGAVIINNNTTSPGGNSLVLKDGGNNDGLYYNPTQNGNAGALFSNYIYSSNIGSRNNDDFLLMYGGGGTKSIKFYGYDGSVQTTRAIIDSNGNFGIGSGISSVPSRFYVSGNSVLQGNLTISGNANISGNYDLYSQIENAKRLAIAYAIAL
jgi:hypothetical protein